MSMFDKFTNDCGHARISFQLRTAKRIGSKYVFTFGKYKGASLVDVLCSDKEYVKYLLENGAIEFTKKDDAKLRSIVYA